jgi:hypothetical protein
MSESLAKIRLIGHGVAAARFIADAFGEAANSELDSPCLACGLPEARRTAPAGEWATAFLTAPESEPGGAVFGWAHGPS